MKSQSIFLKERNIEVTFYIFQSEEVYNDGFGHGCPAEFNCEIERITRQGIDVFDLINLDTIKEIKEEIFLNA